MAVHMEDAKGEQTAERIGNVAGGVEDGESSSELATAVESREVVDDGREEGSLRHPEEPAQSEDAAKVLHRGGEEGHGTKSEHHERDGAVGAEFLGQHGEGRCAENEGHEEDGHDQVVLVGTHAEVVAEMVGLRIAQVALVKSVEKV